VGDVEAAESGGVELGGSVEDGSCCGEQIDGGGPVLAVERRRPFRGVFLTTADKSRTSGSSDDFVTS